MRIFLTDASYKHTLGALRTLGKRGIHVIAGSSTPHSLSFYSKYCQERVIYPSPRDEQKFVSFLREYLAGNHVDVLLPIGYLANTALSRHKAEFDGLTEIPVADCEAMKIAGDKDLTMRFAESVGIRVPKLFINSHKVTSYPVVVKGLIESGKISYANSPEELHRLNPKDALIQEYIPGEGYGFFALFNRGRPRAIFMHKRIREYPITGGPSTVAESIYDEELKRQGLGLLEALKWHGVAMVEFKKDSRDGQFKLMEINPKFWGSLDLATAAGVDFPYLAARMAMDGDIEPLYSYRTGIRFRWLFPDDTLHLLANPGSAGPYIRDFFDRDTITNIWPGDILPNLLQVGETGRQLFRRIKSGTLRYPYGKPEVKD
ncbi:MAG TPA: ATP-grasp domain-containing protein [Methanothrix sp.]|nr:ATP-grasp domain-containing protein [Methanothrix sp.]